MKDCLDARVLLEKGQYEDALIFIASKFEDVHLDYLNYLTDRRDNEVRESSPISFRQIVIVILIIAVEAAVIIMRRQKKLP